MAGKGQKYSKKLKSVGITFHPDLIKRIDKSRGNESRGAFVNRLMAEVMGVKLK